MASFLLLLVCLLLGALIAHLGRPPEGLAKHLNWWVIYIALPATILEIIPHLKFDASLWFLAASIWLIFLGTWLVFHRLGTWLNWSRNTIGAIVLMAGSCNSGFVGFPLIEALRGKEALTYAAIADQLGSFMVINIGGSLVVAWYSGDKIDLRTLTRKTILFPPFIALLVAFLVALTPGWPALLEEVLGRISASLAPLALFAVGLQLRLKLSGHRVAPFTLGLIWKLALAPLLVFGIGLALHIKQPILTVALLQAAMAPTIAAAILAQQADLDPPLASMMAGIGILVSFITVPLWNLLA
ncbi:MAG: AEC family transporter [Steroidobacteraceae bacterium]